ncbi:uncharacterized protein M6B38_136875 [Iris pallida]|uniref:DUF4283 domain-containing protein n=1 Tax=Iris pallida TaxID=29817 RepID=A0AAX6FE75_IRIPA|nr:uncharacterized protein M6B38_136875 [Iris pallida]
MAGPEAAAPPSETSVEPSPFSPHPPLPSAPLPLGLDVLRAVIGRAGAMATPPPPSHLPPSQGSVDPSLTRSPALPSARRYTDTFRPHPGRFAPPAGEAQSTRPFLAAFSAVRRGGFPHLSSRGSPPLRPLADLHAAAASSLVAPVPTNPGSSSKVAGSARSYLEVLGGSAMAPAPQAAEELVLHPRAPVFAQGIPEVTFDEADVDALVVPFKLALIGKMLRFRPPMEVIRRAFAGFRFKGPVSVGLIDNRHILIRPSLEVDFMILRSKQLWFVAKAPMRIFKWTSDFSMHIESPMAPVWVSFYDLPTFLFTKASVFLIVAGLGSPLKLDKATENLSRPSRARVLVEIDISKPLVEQIRINLPRERSFCQVVEYELFPAYYSSCLHLRHSSSNCKSILSKATGEDPSTDTNTVSTPLSPVEPSYDPCSGTGVPGSSTSGIASTTGVLASFSHSTPAAMKPHAVDGGGDMVGVGDVVLESAIRGNPLALEPSHPSDSHAPTSILVVSQVPPRRGSSFFLQ